MWIKKKTLTKVKTILSDMRLINDVKVIISESLQLLAVRSMIIM